MFIRLLLELNYHMIRRMIMIMIKITYLDATSIREFFFESRLEIYNWLKNINTDEKDIYVDHRFASLENLNINSL